MTPSPASGFRWRAVWQSPALEFVVLLAGFWLRLQQLGALPIYWDEAFHIYYARAPLIQHLYFSVFPFARWLNVILIAALQPLGLESLWIARLLSVILSLLTAASAYWVGRWLGSRTTGRLALVLYLVLPFAFFYDRQAMSDPIMAAFGAMGVVFGLRTLKTLSLRDALLSGLFIGLATLTKFSGVLYLPVLFVGAALIPIANRRRALALAVVHAVVCIVLFGALFLLARQENGPSANPVGASNWCHSPLCSGQFDLAQVVALPLTNLRLYLDTIPSFYTPTIWLLAVAALVFVTRSQRTKAWVLGIMAFALALPYILIADLFPPRYLMFTLLPIAALAAYAFERLVNWLRTQDGWVGGTATTVLAAVVFAPALVLEGWQAASPFTMLMPTWEYNQYSAGWPGAIAAENIARYLSAHQKPNERINVLAGGVYLEFYAFWGERLGLVKTTRDVTESTYIPWLAGTDSLCLIELIPTDPLGDTPFGLLAPTVQVFDLPGSIAHPEVFHGAAHANLRCVTGTTPELSHKVDTYVFGDPASAAEYYPAVADQLRNFSGPVFLYPPHQLGILQAQPSLTADLRPLADSWPANFETLTDQITQAATTAPELRFVLALEDRGDPKHRVESWLNVHLFPIDIQFSGPVRVLRFLTYNPVTSAPVLTNLATLGGLGQLTQADILDPVVPSNRLVRLALTWQPSQTPTVSYKVFAHVFDAQGKLIAQHDGLPQAGFAPTDAWQVGQAFTDRFVIYFPPEVPSGVYTVKTGFYDPATGERLTTSDGQDSIEIGQVSIP
jgi:4-amino-4-deoxy-L-arabinose transferase-like glycosyltransferase